LLADINTNKKMKIYFAVIAFVLISISCEQIEKDKTEKMPAVDTVGIVLNNDSLILAEQQKIRDSILSGPDTSWANLQILMPKAKFDIRYADTNNFMKLKVYDCPACFTRLLVAKSLLLAYEKLDSMGLTFIFFDCYRPSSAQWKLWEKMPDPRYVHPPTHGSRHSRGVAVDLSLYDLNAQLILDMGTEFDYFGKEAWWSYQGHSDEVNKNRKILLDIMRSHNFSTVGNEWWHFDFRNQKFNLSDMKWDCVN
jgi:zinc D-Ala-D-Ala dipeptidase